MKMWMFYSWLEDNNENIELYKHHGYLIGSFINPEAASKLNDGTTLSVSDEAFEETSQMIRNNTLQALQQEQANNSSKRRRRRKAT